MIHIYNQIYCAFLLLYVGLYWYIDAFVTDLKAQCLELNEHFLMQKKQPIEPTQSKQSKQNRRSKETALKMASTLKEVIELHNDMLA